MYVCMDEYLGCALYKDVYDFVCILRICLHELVTVVYCVYNII